MSAVRALLAIRQDQAADLARLVAGLPLLQRLIYGAWHAGIDEVVVLAKPAVERLRVLLPPIKPPRNVTWMAWPSLASLGGRGRWVVLHPQLLFEPAVLHALLREPLTPGEVLSSQPPGGESSPALLALEGSVEDLRRLLEDGSLEGGWRVRPLSPGSGLLLPLRTPEDLHRAERALLRRLIKREEGFMSRVFERKVSLAISRRLAPTSVTPSHLSLATTLVGLVAAGALAQPHHTWQIAGSLLFLGSSILDGCDGEIARLKFQESRLGGWLDFLGDNLVHVSVFFAIGLGLFRSGAGLTALWLGTASALGVVLIAGFLALRRFRLKQGPGPFYTTVVEETHLARADRLTQRLAALDNALTRRDFTYLVVGLAILGRLQWFLWVSALGNYLFLLSLLYLYWRAGH